MRKLLKFTFISLSGVILLFAGLVAFTQSRLFKDWLRDKIVLEAGKQLNGSLEIGRIDGNLINNFLISQLTLKDKQDTLLHLQKLALQLRPRFLFSRQIVLKIVSIDSPRVLLRQRADSLWYVSTLIKESQPGSPQAAHTTSWNFALENIAVKNAEIRIFPIAHIPALPQRIAGLNANLSLAFHNSTLSLELKDLHFNARQPDFALQKLSLASTLQDSILSLQNIKLHLRETRLDAACEIHLTATPNYRFQIKAKPLSLDEVVQIYPGVQPGGKPTIALTGVFQHDSLHFRLNISEDNQKIQAEGNLHNLQTTPRYEIAGSLENMDFSRWFYGIDSSLTHRLTGTFSVSGHGNSAESARADLKINLINSQFQQFNFANLELAGKYSAGDVALDVKSSGQSGQIVLRGKIEDALAKQLFDLSGRFDHFNAGKMVAVETIDTDVNLSFATMGQGLSGDSIRADVQINFAPSRITDVEIDTLFCIAHVENGVFAIDTLQVESALGDFYLAGQVSLASNNDVRFRANVGDLRWVAAKIGADTLRMKGTVLGKLQGKMDALTASMDFKLRELSYNTLQIDSLHGNTNVNRHADHLNGQVTSYFHNAGVAETRLDSVYLHSNFSGHEADIEIALSEGQDIFAQSRLHFFADTIPRIDIPEIRVLYKNSEWRNKSGAAFLQIYGDAYSVHDLALVNKEQQISAGGTLVRDGQQDFILTLSNIEIPDMIQLFDPSLTGIAGKLNINSHLTGTLDAPMFSAKLQVRKGRMTKVEFDSLNIDLTYEDALLTWLFQLYKQEKLALRGDGYLPIDLMAADNVEMVDRTRPFRLQVATQGIDLSFLQPFINEITNLQGLFVCDVRIENTLNDPEPVGNLSVFDGALSFPRYGMKYKDIQARLHIDKESIRVTEFDVGTEVKIVKGFRRKKNKAPAERQEMRGRLWIVPGSYVEFDSTGFFGGVDSMNLNIKANEFQLANSSDFQAQISGDMKVFGNVRAPNFDGNMQILRSSLYLPALEESGLYDEERISSLLAGAEIDSLTTAPKAGNTESSAYFNNLRGRLKIEIPKNAWARAPDMNIELAGSLDIVKDGPEFEQPFGTIQVVRGTYDLFNAYKFDIDEGSLFFEGGQDFNPRLDVKAKHTVRARDRSSIELVLNITGRMFSPNLKFWRDNEEIDVTDAVRTLLTGGRREGGTAGKGLLAGNSGKEATGALAGLLTAQLSRFLLNNQVLDMLEIKGDLTGDQATIVLGKYITNKLFLSLEKIIKSGNGTDEGIRDTVAIEYALSRYIILQAITGDEKTTGFDIFWKFSK